MKLIPKEQVLAPGVCIICEHTPMEGESVVDTDRDLNAGPGPFVLNGVKYVCRRCAVAVGEQFGLRPTASVEQAQLDAALAVSRLAKVKERIAEAVASLSPEELAVAEAAAAVPTEEIAAVEVAKEKVESRRGKP